MKLINKLLVTMLVLAGLAAAGSAQTPAKTEQPARVVKVDDDGLLAALKATERPRVVNFWATWCGPCIEEFPDLVKIDNDYRGKIDLVTVSLDDVADIDGLVPDFLKRMKAEMPAFLLVSKDETTLISSIHKDWSGGLPFTVVYGADGKQLYFREGKFKPETLRGEIDKALAPK